MTYDEAVSKARNEANRESRVYVVFYWLNPESPRKYGTCPGSWALHENARLLTVVDPAQRHWNGSRLVETQRVMAYH